MILLFWFVTHRNITIVIFSIFWILFFGVAYRVGLLNLKLVLMYHIVSIFNSDLSLGIIAGSYFALLN